MPLLARIPVGHSIREFHKAAGLRYREGGRLADSGERLAAVYLWGYSAEMLLKAAFFRLIGWSPAQTFTLTDLKKAMQYAKSLLSLAKEPNLHDLERWRDLLIQERNVRRVPYSSLFRQGLNARVKRLSLNWRESLRYHTNRPYRGEVDHVYEAVTWLIGQYRFL